MSLHGLSSVTVGVPDVDAVAEYYAEFGLTRDEDRELSSTDGGCQMTLETAPTRRLVELVIGVDGEEDLRRAHQALLAAGERAELGDGRLRAFEAVTGVRAILEVAPRTPPRDPGGRTAASAGQRSEAILRTGPVRPRRLGHAVFTTTDLAASTRFFVELLGCKISDFIGDVGVFMRCSTDHHNLLILKAPTVYLHHTAWQVDDVDEVGRGATAMLDEHPERHVWGLGRHYAGSNFFWYLRDPAGNYCEYFADIDQIPENADWHPESHEGRHGLYSWGPPPPSSFLRPDDQVELGRVLQHDDA